GWCLPRSPRRARRHAGRARPPTAASTRSCERRRSIRRQSFARRRGSKTCGDSLSCRWLFLRPGGAVVLPPAEIRHRGFLPRGDDAATDFARPPEQVEERLAVAPADGALKRGEVFRE